MLRSATAQPNAFPALIAISTALRLSAGNAPGNPRHTGHTWEFDGAPKAVEHEQKILLRVSSSPPFAPTRTAAPGLVGDPPASTPAAKAWSKSRRISARTFCARK